MKTMLGTGVFNSDGTWSYLSSSGILKEGIVGDMWKYVELRGLTYILLILNDFIMT
jgi:hypothetical protein